MRGPLLLLLGTAYGRAAAAPEEACPAGGPGCGPGHECVKWRQTGGCNPRGPRERHGDKGCHELITSGNSGYCQCGSGDGKLRVREVTCDHRPFTCATECLQAQRYTCVGWRQTGACSSDGPREPKADRSCDDIIPAGMSGFCECGGGRLVRKPGCEHGEFAEPFRCSEECAQESDLYEELDIDAGASDRTVKQAFRKLSLRYHPDKTRGNPALTARFAAIREAYDVLNDPEQRAIYDTAGLKLLYQAKSQQVEKGPSMTGEVTVSLEALYNGEETKRQIHRKVICRGCAERFTERCKKCNVQCANEIELRNVQMGPMVMQQQVEVPSKQKCRLQRLEFPVGVERGMASGDTITFKGRGEQQPKKIPGDLVLTLRMAEHKTFRRAGVDLHVDMDVSLDEALLGFEHSLLHLDGRRVELAVRAVTRPGAVLRVRGEGMPFKGDPTQRGDLFVKFSIGMPRDGRKWLREACAGPGGPSGLQDANVSTGPAA